MIFNEREQDLVLDPSVVYEKRQSGSSLTDLYGADAFTDQFADRKSAYLESLKRLEEMRYSRLFAGYQPGAGDEAAVGANLFQTARSIQYDNSQEMGRNSTGQYIIACVLVTLLFFLLLIKQLKKKKESQTDETMYYSGDAVRQTADGHTGE